MKLEDLLESPQLIPSELPPRQAKPFITDDSLKRRFSPIDTGETPDGLKYFVFIKKNLEDAVIGIPGIRFPDNASGLDVIGTVEFKSNPILSGKKNLNFLNRTHLLQVGLVHVGEKRQGFGWGLQLYASLASAGYIIVSDNTQYLGGQALWKRIAKETLGGQYQVFVIQDGELLLNDVGDPVEYNGSNINDAELWSNDAKNKYSLFMLKYR